jgi:tRNA-uridine 2-sulfurtransferase
MPNSEIIKTRQSSKVVVAMSGGVDSSVAAALLKRQGHEVVGVFMRHGGTEEPAEDASCTTGGCDRNNAKGGGSLLTLPQAKPAGKKAHKQGCCSVNDADDARLVAAMLDIPFYVLNFEKDFGRIIDYFVAEYNAGRTPNPCVRCNDWLKFGRLFDFADSIDAQYVATGHYARIGRSGQWPVASGQCGEAETPHRSPVTGYRSPPRLLTGLDPTKDQSYVLFGTPRERLHRMLLPIGEMTKRRTRELAEQWELPVFNKPDSQEICFVPDQDYAGLIRRRTPEQVHEGEIRDTAGHRLGSHPGHQHFTLGQRRGLGLSHPSPLYVVDKDPATNTLVVGSRDELLADGAMADQVNWLADEPPRDWQPCTVKVRYNSPPLPGRVRLVAPDRLEASFDHPVSAVTPGQALVCYNGESVLGGGWVREVIPHGA